MKNNARSGILYKKYDLSNVKIFQKNSLFRPERIRRPLFFFKGTKNTGFIIFNFLKEKKLTVTEKNQPMAVKKQKV